MAHPRNILKILIWLSHQKIGYRFTASDIGKELGLTSQDIGNTLKWHLQYVEKDGKTSDNSRTVWRIHALPIKPKLTTWTLSEV